MKKEWIELSLGLSAVVLIFYTGLQINKPKLSLCPKDGQYDIVFFMNKQGGVDHFMCIERKEDHQQHLDGVPYSKSKLKRWF